MSRYLRLLGTPSIEHGGDRIELVPGKGSAVLCFLACEQGWVSRDRLLSLFWPEKPEAMARSSLRKLLSTLRRTPYAVGLDIGTTRVRWTIETDLGHFRQALADGAHARAVGLYEGGLLDGFSPRDTPEFDTWLEFERKELRDQWRATALELAADLETSGNLAEQLQVLTRLNRADPLDEAVLRRLLSALRTSGQHERAVRTFESFCQMLRHELGSEPEAATVRQIEQLRQEAATAMALLEPVPSRAPARHLPVRPTSFIGRLSEMASAIEALADRGCRMVTMTGPGGVGKTRLALEVGIQLQRSLAHGVHFVPLASIAAPELVASAIASAIGLPSSPGDPRARLLDHLRDKELLLILDNFEHLLGAADFVSEVLAEAARVKVLVTSRAPLRLYGEHEYVVHPFPLPDAALEAELLQQAGESPGHDALRLFVERARAVSDGFRLTAANVGAVAEVCTRLDGLPLAIELAAAQCKLHSPQTLLSRLDDRFILLRNGARDLPARHQALRATMDWSYNLLSARDQQLFRSLAVFRGGWTLQAAEAICYRRRDPPGAVLDGVARLLDHSLLHRDVSVDEEDGEPRFAMLETLHAYGLEQLQLAGELAGTRRKHAVFFLALAEEAEPRLTGKERRPWLRRLNREHDNLRAALQWSKMLSGTEDIALRLVGALYWFWYFRGNIDEAHRLAEEALQSVDPSTSAAAKALYTAGTLTWLAGDYPAARARLAQSAASFDRLGDIEGLAVSLLEAAVVAMFQNEFATSHELHTRSVGLLRQAGSSWHLAFALTLFAHLLLAQGDDEGAASCLEEGRLRFQRLEDAWGVSFAFHGLGLLACRRRHDAAATTYLQEALAIRSAEADEGGCAEVLHLLGETALRQGELERSARLCVESLILYRRVSDRAGIAQALHTLGKVALLQGHHDRATRLFAAAATLWHALAGAYPLAMRTSDERERDIASAQAALGEPAFAAAWGAAEALSLRDAVMLAVAT